MNRRRILLSCGKKKTYLLKFPGGIQSGYSKYATTYYDYDSVIGSEYVQVGVKSSSTGNKFYGTDFFIEIDATNYSKVHIVAKRATTSSNKGIVEYCTSYSHSSVVPREYAEATYNAYGEAVFDISDITGNILVGGESNTRGGTDSTDRRMYIKEIWLE